MKKITLILISFITYLSVNAQDIKTGEGESSIVLPTANIGIDVKEASLSFKINNFSQAKVKSNSFLWGFYAKGKNNEGITTVFSGSKINPSSSLSINLGYSFSNSDKISQNISSSHLKKKTDYLTKYLDENLELEVRKLANQISNDSIKLHLQSIITEALKNKNIKYKKLECALLDEVNNNKDSVIGNEAKILHLFVKNYKPWKEINNISDEQYRKIENAFDFNNEVSKMKSKGSESYWKLTIYSHFGLESQKFNIFKGWDPTNLTDSFDKETFRGSNGGFGVNYLFNSKWILGFKYTYQETNNLSTLSSTDYKISTNNVLGSSTGSTQISKTAYPNEYKRAYLNRLDFDFLKFFSLGESSIILSDLYFRVNESTNNDNLVSTKTLGISASFFEEKGKFIGGLYLELPDIEQRAEKRKPVADRNLQSWHNRLSFGIYAQYSFSSLIGSSF